MKKIYIGIMVAFISAISDVLLLYHPQLISKYEKYQFLFEINGYRNTLGWVLGMICLPLLWLGYKGTKEIADECSQQALEKTDWVVIFLISLGCVVHSVYHFTPLFHLETPTLSDMEISSIKLIELVFVAFYIMFCTIITLQSLRVKNILLYANRYFNPLFWMIFVVIITIITPRYGGYLAVSAFNLSIGFYFIGIVVNRKKVA
jgi:hypothetical protein